MMWLSTCLPWLLLASLIQSISAHGYHGEPCSKYGCPLAPPIHEPFVPAPPGYTPNCAKPGLTFCESLDRYPQQLIKFLIDKRSAEIERFLRDESAESFNAFRKKPNYDEQGYDYPKPKVPSELYPQPVITQVQAPILHYNVPLNVTLNTRYLPAPNPYILQAASASSYQSSYSSSYQSSNQLRPQYPTEFFNPNQAGPWQVGRNSRGIGSGLDQTSSYQNPLLEFARGGGVLVANRAKRQSDSNAVSICPTRSQFVVPRAALNNQGNWMFVVNLEEQQKYSQLVRSEICMSDTCDGLCSLPLGYTSKCKQQYVQKRLVALEGSGNRLYTDVFWFPHGCMCQVSLEY